MRIAKPVETLVRLAGCAVPLCALLDCSPAVPTEDLYIQLDSSDDVTLEATKQAAAEWRVCGGRQVYVTAVMGPSTVPLTVVDVRDPGLHGNRGNTAVVEGKVVSIKISEDTRPVVLRPLIAHEIGHMLIIRSENHGHFGSGLMRGETLNQADHVTAEDCAALPERE